MKLVLTHREFLDFANGVAECRSAISAGQINSNRMFSFYVDSLVKKLKDDVLTLSEHIDEAKKPVVGEDVYWKELRALQTPSEDGADKTEMFTEFKDRTTIIRAEILQRDKGVKEFLDETIEIEVTQISFKYIPDDMHDSTLFNKVFKETEDEILEIIANG